MAETNGKDRLREKALAQRAGLNVAEISSSICQKIESWQLFQNAQTVLAYKALPHEISLESLIAKYPQKDWYLPRILPGRNVMFHRYTPGNELSENTFGIPEPLATQPDWTPDQAETSLIFVPALMLDQKGGRLGFGQGYYDRFLAQLPSKTETATPISSQLLTPGLPQDTWDVPIHYAITESGIISLR